MKLNFTFLVCASLFSCIEMSAETEPEMVEQKVYRVVQKSGDVFEAVFIQDAGADLVITCKTTYGAGTYSKRIARNTIERIIEDKRIVRNPVIVEREVEARRRADEAEAEVRRKANEDYESAKAAEAAALDEIKKGPEKLISSAAIAPFQLVEIRKKWSYSINRAVTTASDAIVFTPELSFSVENTSDSELAALKLRFVFWKDEKRVFDEVDQYIVFASDIPLRPTVISKRFFLKTSMGFKGEPIDFSGQFPFGGGSYRSPDFDMWVEIQYQRGPTSKWQSFTKFRLMLDAQRVQPRLQ